MRFPEIDKRWEHSGNLCWLTTVQLVRRTLYFLYNQREKVVFHANMYLKTLRFYQFYMIVTGCWEKNTMHQINIFTPNTRAYLSVSIIWNICTFMKVRGGTNMWEKIVTIWIQNKIWEKILWKSHRQFKGPKALSNLTHSTIEVQSRSFNKIWNFQLGFFLAKGRNT